MVVDLNCLDFEVNADSARIFSEDVVRVPQEHACLADVAVSDEHNLEHGLQLRGLDMLWILDDPRPNLRFPLVFRANYFTANGSILDIGLAPRRLLPVLCVRLAAVNLVSLFFIWVVGFKANVGMSCGLGKGWFGLVGLGSLVMDDLNPLIDINQHWS